jgi:hypothetical protein
MVINAILLIENTVLNRKKTVVSLRSKTLSEILVLKTHTELKMEKLIPKKAAQPVPNGMQTVTPVLNFYRNLR